MIYLTIIIVVALICATKLTPVLLRHRLKYERAYKIEIYRLQQEIKDLKAENTHVYNHWFNDLDKRNTQYSALLDKLYKLEHPEEEI